LDAALCGVHFFLLRRKILNIALARGVIEPFAVRDAEPRNVRRPGVPSGRHFDVLPFARAGNFIIVRAPFAAANRKVQVAAHVTVANPEPRLARGRIAGQRVGRIAAAEIFVGLILVRRRAAAGRVGIHVTVGDNVKNFGVLLNIRAVLLPANLVVDELVKEGGFGGKDVNEVADFEQRTQNRRVGIRFTQRAKTQNHRLRHFLRCDGGGQFDFDNNARKVRVAVFVREIADVENGVPHAGEKRTDAVAGRRFLGVRRRGGNEQQRQREERQYFANHTDTCFRARRRKFPAAAAPALFIQYDVQNDGDCEGERAP